MKSLVCPYKPCSLSRKTAAGNVIRHRFYKTSRAKPRCYQCQSCRKTFCSITVTPYPRLQHRRAIFDEVASLTVEGLSKSAIAQVQKIAWNTVVLRRYYPDSFSAKSDPDVSSSNVVSTRLGRIQLKHEMQICKGSHLSRFEYFDCEWCDWYLLMPSLLPDGKTGNWQARIAVDNRPCHS
jgi:transposase-like protein